MNIATLAAMLLSLFCMLLALYSMTAPAQAAPLTASATRPAGSPGSIATSRGSSAGAVTVIAPANVTDTTARSNALPIKAQLLAFSGTGNSNTNATPTYATQQAPLAKRATSCATWDSGALVNVNFSLALFPGADGQGTVVAQLRNDEDAYTCAGGR
jgi:hypothetical protein